MHVTLLSVTHAIGLQHHLEQTAHVTTLVVDVRRARQAATLCQCVVHPRTLLTFIAVNSIL